MANATIRFRIDGLDASATTPNSEEISDDLAQAAAEYANLQPVSTGIVMDCSLVRSSFDESREHRALRQDAAIDFVAGARWQRNADGVELAAMKSALTEGADSIGKLLSEVDRLEKQLAMKEEPDRALGDVALVPTPIVFRSDDERDFWDEQVHALNRRGDRSTRDVANAADEMVEERRKRMEIRIVSETEVRPVIVGIQRGDLDANASFDFSSVPIGVLDEAIRIANEATREPNEPNDRENALRALRIKGTTPWQLIVRQQVADSIDKARKT